MVRMYKSMTRRFTRRKRYTARRTYKKYKVRPYTRGFRVFGKDAEIKYNTLTRVLDLDTVFQVPATGVEFSLAVGANTSLSAVGQGATAETRVGNAIKAKWLELAGQVTAASFNDLNADAGVDEQTISSLSSGNKSRTQFRIIVFKDNQYNSTETHISSLSNTVLQAGGPLVNSMLYIPNMGRFQILAQKWLDCDHTDPSKSFRMRINLRNLNMRFNGPTAGSLLQSNRIHFAIVALSPLTLSGNIVLSPTVSYTSRMAFSDV